MRKKRKSSTISIYRKLSREKFLGRDLIERVFGDNKYNRREQRDEEEYEVQEGLKSYRKSMENRREKKHLTLGLIISSIALAAAIGVSELAYKAGKEHFEKKEKSKIEKFLELEERLLAPSYGTRLPRGEQIYYSLDGYKFLNTFFVDENGKIHEGAKRVGENVGEEVHGPPYYIPNWAEDDPFYVNRFITYKDKKGKVYVVNVHDINWEGVDIADLR